MSPIRPSCGINGWLDLSYRIADAEENLGESEVREAHLAKSLFFIRIGDKVGDYYYSPLMVVFLHY